MSWSGGTRSVVIFGTLLLALSACAGGGDVENETSSPSNETSSPSTDEVADGLHIGVVVPALFIEAIANLASGIEARAGEVGNIRITLVDTLDSQEMVNAMEDFVAQGVDAIIYNSIDGAAMTAGVEAANRAGIPVFATVARADGGEHVTFIAADEQKGGVEVGNWIGKKLGGSGSMAIVQGAAGDQANRLRHDGVMKALENDYPEIDVVADLPADWLTDRALTVTSDILTANPDVDAVFAVNDDMAYGSLEALREAGRLGQTLLVGYNGDCRVFEHIIAGEMHAVGVLFLGSVGRMAVDAVLDHLAGKDVPAEIISPVLVIDKEALEQVMAGVQPTGIVEPYLSEFKSRAQQAADGC